MGARSRAWALALGVGILLPGWAFGQPLQQGAGGPPPPNLAWEWKLSPPVVPQPPKPRPPFPNGALPDAADWNRASPYVFLEVFSPPGVALPLATPHRGFRSLAVGERVDVAGFAPAGLPQGPPPPPCPAATGGWDSPACPLWLVNSPYAQVTPDPGVAVPLPPPAQGGRWRTTPAYTFVAWRPGVYTVQMRWRGTYSQPLVLVVGVGQLASAPFPYQGGVRPLPPGQLTFDTPVVTRQSPYGVVWVGRPIEGYLPLVARVPHTAPHAVALAAVLSTPVADWTYELPFWRRGQVSDLVYLPWGGAVTVALYQVQVTGARVALWPRAVLLPTRIRGARASPLGTANPNALATLSLDANDGAMAPLLAQAAAIWRDSPSPQTAVAALATVTAQTLSGAAAAPTALASQVWASGQAPGPVGYVVALAAVIRALGLNVRLVPGQWRMPDGRVVPSAWMAVDTASGWMPLNPSLVGEAAPFWVTNLDVGNTASLAQEAVPPSVPWLAASQEEDMWYGVVDPPPGLYTFPQAASLAYTYYTQTPLDLSELALPGHQLGAYPLPGYVSPSSLRGGLPVENYAAHPFCHVPRVEVVTPTGVANAAMAYWNLYWTGQAHGDVGMAAADRQEFLLLSRWLLTHQTQGAWRWPIPAPCYGLLHPGWISALTQGEGVSALLRAYQLTGEKAYLRVAQEAVGYLERPVSQGGTLAPLGHGLWPQEYPASPPPNVLNGGITAALGLWEDWKATGNVQAQKVFRQVTTTLAHNLPLYQYPGWARYDLAGSPSPAPIAYMSLQIRELRILYALTGQVEMRHVADAWLEDITPGPGERAAQKAFLAYTLAQGARPYIPW
jgi:hypothetical protein